MSLLKKHKMSSPAERTPTFSRSKIKSAASVSANFFYYPKLMAALLVLTGILLVTKVYFSNQLAVSGAKVSYSNSELSDLTAEKYNLENELSAKSSLSYIDQKAQEMGMVKVNKVEVVRIDPNVAFKP